MDELSVQALLPYLSERGTVEVDAAILRMQVSNRDRRIAELEAQAADGLGIPVLDMADAPAELQHADAISNGT